MSYENTSSSSQALLQRGVRVRVDERTATGHCRAPWYLRGQTGEIVEFLGIFRDPEKLAYNKPGLPRIPLYKVRFRQADLWRGYSGPLHDHLEADITENWLIVDGGSVAQSDNAIEVR